MRACAWCGEDCSQAWATMSDGADLHLECYSLYQQAKEGARSSMPPKPVPPKLREEFPPTWAGSFEGLLTGICIWITIETIALCVLMASHLAK